MTEFCITVTPSEWRPGEHAAKVDEVPGTFSLCVISIQFWVRFYSDLYWLGVGESPSVVDPKQLGAAKFSVGDSTITLH